ncbi:hypothetical protein [Flavobacterium kingsejongi]|uniref:Uncharacterized protein n=1 Tax=Flavobacterium kingsejongi TaxID=1678728 RepID=A0A2S1LRI0_9FLAO|nr:hypothetical protein [Flavobacterium kingsejongi]AWG26329.1 hypothetical protein FK004_14375 [Flavobacterium kingsejongi]
MTFTLQGGTIVDFSKISYRSLGFGEATTLPVKKFKLEIGYSALKPEFIDKAALFIEECQAEDEGQGYSDVPELRDLGYPDFIELVEQYPDVAGMLITDYLYFDFLKSLFGAVKQPELIINTVLGVVIKNSVFAVYGEVFEQGK